MNNDFLKEALKYMEVFAKKSSWKAGEGLGYMVGNAVFSQESAPLKSIKDTRI